MIAILPWFYRRLGRSLGWGILALTLLALPVVVSVLGPVGLLDDSSSVEALFYDVAFLSAPISGILALTFAAELDTLAPTLSPRRWFGIHLLLALLPPAHFFVLLVAEGRFLLGWSPASAAAALLPILLLPAAIVVCLQHVPIAIPAKVGAFLLLVWVLPAVLEPVDTAPALLLNLTAVSRERALLLAAGDKWSTGLAAIPPIITWLSVALALAHTTRRVR